MVATDIHRSLVQIRPGGRFHESPPPQICAPLNGTVTSPSLPSVCQHYQTLWSDNVSPVCYSSPPRCAPAAYIRRSAGRLRLRVRVQLAAGDSGLVARARLRPESECDSARAESTGVRAGHSCVADSESDSDRLRAAREDRGKDAQGRDRGAGDREARVGELNGPTCDSL